MRTGKNISIRTDHRTRSDRDLPLGKFRGQSDRFGIALRGDLPVHRLQMIERFFLGGNRQGKKKGEQGNQPYSHLDLREEQANYIKIYAGPTNVATAENDPL